MRRKKPDAPSLAEAVEAAEDGGLALDIRALLTRTRKRWRIVELADKLDVSPSKIRSSLARLELAFVSLHVDGDGVQVRNEIQPSAPTVIDTRRMKGAVITLGLTGDNHLGSMYERMDILNALFDIWADQGVTTVLQAGNMIDGEARFNKFDIYAHGIEEQCDNFIEKWPQRKGVKTQFITGDDHEGWYIQREGVDIGQLMADKAKRAGRDDLEYIGHMEHDIRFEAEHGAAVLRLIHAGGGSAYAISYTDQKVVESYQGGEKPNILVVGHFHKFNFGYPREVATVQVGCTQDQTPFLRKKRIQAMLGGVTLSFTQSPDGLLHGISAQWWPFYDRDFYTSKVWKYQWPKLGRRA